MITRLTAVTGVLGISFAAIFVALADVEPVTATAFRALLALPFLAGAAAYVHSRDGRSASMRSLAFASGLLLAIDVTLFNQTIDLIGAGLATLLANTQVLFVGAIAWALHRERPTKKALITVPIVLVGVAFVSGLGRSDAFGEDPVAGVLFGLATGAAYAIFLLRSVPPIAEIWPQPRDHCSMPRPVWQRGASSSASWSVVSTSLPV